MMVESKTRIGGSGNTTMTFGIRTLTPEEDLRNEAQSIVYGYQRPHLGPRQCEMLDCIRVYRYGQWGDTYKNRRVLASLEKRGLIKPMIPQAEATDWALTDLGAAVAALLKEANQ